MTRYSNIFRTLAASFAFAAASMTATAQTGVPGTPGGGTGDPNYVPGYAFPYGQGCGSSIQGPMVLTMNDLPDIGTDIVYELSNGPAGNPAWLMLGLAPLFVDLTPIGGWGCHLYVDPLLVINKNVSAVGTAEFEYSIPNVPAAIGVHLFAQGIAQAPMANALGLVLTNGIEASIGGAP